MSTLKQFLTPYPKNSCNTCFENCFADSSVLPIDKNAQPLSLANENPIDSEANNFKCNNTRYTNFDQQPILPHPTGHTILNENFGLNESPNFFQVNCDNKNLENCTGTWVTRNDPRLYNNAIAQAVVLNKPPFTAETPLNEVYSDKLTDYGKTFYNTYDQINSGQIQYYVDHSLEEALFNPVFQIKSNVTSSIFKDPMGSLKPQYDRDPLTAESRNISDYSFDRDTMSFREDITIRNMAKMNQVDWSKTWKNIQK